MSKKIISIHNSKCETLCEHSDVCYFVNAKSENEQVGDDVINNVVSNITYNKDIHYSACNLQQTVDICDKITTEQNEYTYVTMNKLMLKKINFIYENKKELDYLHKFIQLTVYSYDDIIADRYGNYQKLFLIKDDETYQTAIYILKQKEQHKIHFPVEQNWAAANENKLIALVSYWNQLGETTMSLDSCLENYVTNGTCVYANEYIDLRFDGTVRRCPFSDERHNISDYDRPDDMFDILFEPKCIYHKLFGGVSVNK